MYMRQSTFLTDTAKNPCNSVHTVSNALKIYRSYTFWNYSKYK